MIPRAMNPPAVGMPALVAFPVAREFPPPHAALGRAPAALGVASYRFQA